MGEPPPATAAPVSKPEGQPPRPAPQPPAGLNSAPPLPAAQPSTAAVVITPTATIHLAPKTYASAVGASNMTIPDFGVLSTCRGEPALFISRGEMEVLARPFQNALIARFLDYRPRIEEVRKFFIKLELKAECKTGLLDNKHVLVQPGCLEDYNRLYARGEWAIGQCRFVFSKWSLEYKFNEDSSLVPIWFEIPGLPIPLLNPHYVEKIGKLIGRPLQTDSATTDLRRPSIARVLVEVDIRKPKCTRVWLGEDAHTGCWQPVLPEQWPNYCEFCKRIGHEEDNCFKKHPPIPKQNRNGAGKGQQTKGDIRQNKNTTQVYQVKKVGESSNNNATDDLNDKAITTLDTSTDKRKNTTNVVSTHNSFEVLSDDEDLVYEEPVPTPTTIINPVILKRGSIHESMEKINKRAATTRSKSAERGQAKDVNLNDLKGFHCSIPSRFKRAGVRDLGSPKSADQINKRINGKKPYFNYKPPSVWELNTFYESIPTRFKKANIEGWNVHVVYAAHQAGMITSDSETEAEKDDEAAHDSNGEGVNKDKEAGDASVPPDQSNEDITPLKRKKKGCPNKKDKKNEFKPEPIMSRMRTRSQGGSYDIDDFRDYADYEDYDYF